MSLVIKSIFVSLFVGALISLNGEVKGGSGNGVVSAQFTLFGQSITPLAEPTTNDNNNRLGGDGEEESAFVREQKKLYLDQKCYVDTMRGSNVDMSLGASSPTGQVVSYLLKLRCDLKQIIRQFSVLLRLLDQTTATKSLEDERSISFWLIVPSVEAMDCSDEALATWSEYSKFYNFVDAFVREAMSLINQRDFCTYSTIAKFAKLKNWTRGSRLLALASDLVITDYHRSCLKSTIEKLPEVPYVVKDIVKMYIDGVEDTRKPDLNDPAYLEIDAGFDIDFAIAREGSIDQVASLMLTIPSQAQGGSFKELFRSECRDLLMKLEEQWQPMEMMNQMLATESNAILQLNNLIMHSIIPQKYAQICSQLIMKA